MGLIMHDAIVVTAFRRPDIELAHKQARELELPVSNVVAGPINGCFSFFIAPDGSKEGWSDSEKFDELRGKWLDWAARQYSKNVFIDWVHVRFGENPAYVKAASNGDEP